MEKLFNQSLPKCQSLRARMCAERSALKVLPAGASVHCKVQRGVDVVDFALILPILLLLLLGTIDGSLALYDKAVITNASREGARAGIVARNPKLTDAEIRQVVLNYTNGSLIHFGPGKPPPVVNVVQSTVGTTPSTLGVTVSYTFQGIGLGGLFNTLGQPWVLTSNTVMVHE